jgi:uncharacterized membrane protein YesL
MRIDTGGKTYQGVSTFLSFIALNLLYLLTCVPVVTIGMATSALFEVTLRYSDDDGGSLIADYFRAFKANAWRATAVYASLVIPMFALAFSGFFWMFQGGSVSLIATIIAFLGTLYLFAAFLYGVALVARYRNSYLQTMKNALLFPAAEPWRTFVLIVIPATVVSITAIFPVFMVILLTVGFSVGVYASGFLLRNVFARH